MRLGHALLVLTFGASISRAQFPVGNLSRLGDYESRRTSSYDRTGANHDYENLKAGGQLVLFDEAGPAEVRHIWITMASPEAYHLKKIVLRMYWDGETTPSVETPIGDFFGLGLGTYAVFQSSLIVVAPEKALNAYFPMPFQHSGKITVTNEGSEDASDFYWNIDWVKLPALPADTAYFHAQYRQCTPCRGWFHGNFYGNGFSEARKDPRWHNVSGEGNYVFLEAKGDGQLAGVTLSVFQNQWGGWNEGDEMIWIDGEKEPRIHGTGGEDYFNGAWGFSALYSFPLVGLTEFHGWEPGRDSLTTAGTWRRLSVFTNRSASQLRTAMPTFVPTISSRWPIGIKKIRTMRFPNCRQPRCEFLNSLLLEAPGRIPR